ncbi:hypothetical protein HYT23_04640 [Candidatus Pacearchaeota archaeon]|nr:hypothetical protein [Candidatus Pacearchaeota archaeon]
MAFIQDLGEAEKIIKAIDHMLYVTYPLIKDKRLLIKILKESKNSIFLCISAALQYEYIQKRIRLYEDSRRNFSAFIECSKKYGIKSEEIKKILELSDIIDSHKSSSIELYKNGKLVILSENMSQKSVSLEKTKEFLQLSKEIFRKIKSFIILRQ